MVQFELASLLCWVLQWRGMSHLVVFPDPTAAAGVPHPLGSDPFQWSAGASCRSSPWASGLKQLICEV